MIIKIKIKVSIYPAAICQIIFKIGKYTWNTALYTGNKHIYFGLLQGKLAYLIPFFIGQ